MNLRDKLKLTLLQKGVKEKEPIWLEYLESNGEQWIDTGYRNKGTKQTLSVTYQVVSYGGTFYFSGEATVPYNIQVCFAPYNYGVKVSIYPSVDSEYKFANEKDFLGKHTLVCTAEAGMPIKQTVDGVEGVATSNVYEKVSKRSSQLLFSNENYRGSKNDSFKGKVYSYQYYDNDKLVRNLRPCLNPETLRPAMYDTVEKKYYYNQGKGEFKYEHTFTKLDYLESTSYEHDTNYIDTLITPTQKMSFNIKLQAKYHSWDRPFGADNICKSEMHNREGFRMTWQSNTIAIPASQTEPFIYTQDRHLGYLNGELVATYNTYPFTSSHTLRLFSCTDGTRDAICKIYYCDISEEGILKRDYIPVHMDDGRLGMWDFVTGEFFANLGTIKFKGYLNGHQIGESLQGDGNSWIDTEVKTAENLELSMYTSHNLTGTALYGARRNETHSGICYFDYASTGYVAFGSGTVPTPSLEQNICILVNESKPVRLYTSKSLTTIDGKKISQPAYSGFETNYPMALFGCVNGLVIDGRLAKGKIYSTVIKDNGKLIRNFVPFKKGEVIGMYDTMHNKEYLNVWAVSGNFIFNE